MTAVANIGSAGRRRRLRFGLIFLVVSALLAAGLIASGVPRGWRALLFLPLWAAALGVFQARERT
jgi:hypothetical protein